MCKHLTIVFNINIFWIIYLPTSMLNPHLVTSSFASSVCKYWTISICILSMWELKASSGHHHLHLQYVNIETSSISSVWEYWNIIICIFSIEIPKHHHLPQQYINTETINNFISMLVLKTKSSIILDHHLHYQHRDAGTSSSSSST